VTADKGCHGSGDFPCSNLIDGNYMSMAHSDLWGPHWMRIQMLHEAQVETLYVQNREDCCAERMKGTIFSVGNSENIEENPTCPQPVNGSAIFPCGLKGKYIGIY